MSESGAVQQGAHASSPSERFFSHSANPGGHRNPLADHLTGAAGRAGRFAEPLGMAGLAAAAALVHDLGKYADQFQRRLENPQRERGRDHCTTGAVYALECYKRIGLLPALAILGHHVGLDELTQPRGGRKAWKLLHEKLVNSLSANPEAYSETRLALLRERFRADGLKLQRIDEPSVLSGLPCDDMLDVRMLFSALVDADFIETEAHFAGTADQPRIYRGEGPALNPAKALTALETYLHTLPRQSSSQMQQMRDALRQHCLEAAERPTGLFTLSAPTGSGKTLAMLSFALRHAQRHNLRRVVLVMPFLNIIDQTVGKYRQIFSSEAGFPEHYVLEDHSLAGSPNEGEDESADSADPGRQVRRLLAENWDAPIVLTTNVKCLESLMANRPGACRKLHRLARSVIMFDEVQTFPAELATATLATLSRRAVHAHFKPQAETRNCLYCS